MDANHSLHHRKNWIEAFRNLNKLSILRTPQEQFYFLRGLNCFIFEEMVMTALRRAGYKIYRNKSYTGDNGIDGRAYKNDQLYLIQVKRYQGHIKPQHVKEFVRICKQRNAHGLFVHTGKTGPKSWAVMNHTNIKIISGTEMLKLLLSGNNHE